MLKIETHPIHSQAFAPDDGNYAVSNFMTLGRVCRLQAVLKPEKASIVNQLQALWAKIYHEAESPEKLSLIQDAIRLELGNISPLALSKTQLEIDALAPAQEAIKEFAERKFRSARGDGQSLYQEIYRDRKELNRASNLMIERLQGLWDKWKRQLETKEFSVALRDISEELSSFSPQIEQIYMEDLYFAKNIEGIRNRIIKYQKDHYAISSFEPLIQPTADGATGYPKLLLLQRAPASSRSNPHSIPPKTGFMKHLSHKQEIEWHFLYQFFLDQVEGNIPLKTPKGAVLDLEERLYIGPSMESIELTEQEKLHLQKLNIFMAIVSRKDAARSLDEENAFHQQMLTRPIGLFEKIPNTYINLCPFFEEQYSGLSEEGEEALYTSLGMTAYLDLVLRNMDRLNRFENPEELNAELYRSNIANLMIKSAPSSASVDATIRYSPLYLIDNGMGDGSSSSSLDQTEAGAAAYARQLEAFLSHDYSVIANSLIEKGLGPIISEMDGNVGREFSSKKGRISLKIQEGMRQMRTLLESHIIPHWNAKKNSLRISSELRAAVDQYLSAVLRARPS